MQCASSTTSNGRLSAIAGSTFERNLWFPNRSGEIKRRSTSPRFISASMRVHLSTLDELMVRVTTPILLAASSWLRINASKGDTNSVGPAPRTRNSLAAMKYTILLPQPARCTRSNLLLPLISSCIASHWPSRNSAASSPVPCLSSCMASFRNFQSAGVNEIGCIIY